MNWDDLGIYLDHNKSFFEMGKMVFTRILVHLDTKEDLVESLSLQC